MKNILKILLLSLLFTNLLAVPSLTLAQEASTTAPSNPLMETMKNIADKGSYQTDPTKASLPKLIGLIIRTALNLLGVIFLILMVLAGFNWMTSEGNEEQVKKAKRTIKHSLIGLIVAISAWTIWSFVFEKLILGQ